MPSTASTLLKVELQAAGENSNTWGAKANDAFSRLEEGIAGRTAVTLNALVTLTDTQYAANEARAMVLDVSGTGGFNIVIPNRSKVYFVRNASSGIATMTTGAGTTVAIAAGDVEWVYCNGSNAVYRVALPGAAISADAITYAKMQNISATDMVLGRSTAGAGDPEEIPCTAAGRSLIAGAAASNQRTTLGLGTIATQDEATAAQIRANTASKALSTDKAWSSVDTVVLTDAATIAVDMSTLINGSVTLAGNRTLGNPTNTTNGKTGVIYITQDATGTRTLAYASSWKFAAGVAPTLTTTANATDMLIYQVKSATFIYASLVRDVK